MNTNKHEFRKPETLVNAWLGSFPNENTCLLVSSCREHISIATPAGQSRSAADWFTEYDKILELPSKGLASVFRLCRKMNDRRLALFALGNPPINC